jgi:hypothetical protein
MLVIAFTELIIIYIKHRKKMTTVNALVIFCTLLGKKQYVSKHSTRPDNKYLVQLSQNVEAAIPFVTEQEAHTVIARIYNPHDRVYETEPALVPKADVKPVKLPKQKIA